MSCKSGLFLLLEVNLANGLPEGHTLETGDLEFVLARLTGTISSLYSIVVSIDSRIIKISIDPRTARVPAPQALPPRTSSILA